jgi:hypothetical protein
MPSSLREELGVTTSGTYWEIGDFQLWPSTQPEVIFFLARKPMLARNAADGRYQAALSVFHQRVEGANKIIGGSAMFTITTAVQHEAQSFERLKEQWRAAIFDAGYSGSRNPGFIPLPIRKVEARVLIDPQSGQARAAGDAPDTGTPGGTTSFLVDLTELGAREWAHGIQMHQDIPAAVSIAYEYPRVLPELAAQVRGSGRRIFARLSEELRHSPDGLLYGSSARIKEVWENLVRTQVLEVDVPGGLPPELDALRQTLVSTFAEQARQYLFDSLFAPMPRVERPQAGDQSGGAYYACRWRREADAVDVNLELRFEGWTWLMARMDADARTLFEPIDETSINRVYVETSYPVSITIHGDPLLENVALSWSASEGKSPEALVFGPDGGTAEYVLRSVDPDNVTIRYNAKVNFQPPSWPIIEIGGEEKVSRGGNRIVLQPGAWVARLMIYLAIREGETIKPLGELPQDEYLVVNVSYMGPHLRQPIKESARMTTQTSVEFTVPRDPRGHPGQAKFSAFGFIGGRMVHAREQPISFESGSAYILVSLDGIQLVSRNAVVPEDDRLAQRLLAADGRPLVIDHTQRRRT